MDIQQHIYNNTDVLLPIAGGNGIKSKTVFIDSKVECRLLTVVEMVFVNGKFYK
jgi:hypothetical protein